MAAGFAVQLVDLTPERRAGLADLVKASGDAPAAASSARAGGAAQLTGAALLRELEGRQTATHYGLLGLPPDAEFSEIRRCTRELRTSLEALRARPEAADQHARATALLGRLDLAQQKLSVPAERLVYDVLRGNYLGVARCVAAGVPQAVIEARRREHLASHPEKAAAAQSHLSRAQVARKLGNVSAATAAYEAALAADPLDLKTLEAYVTLRRQAG
jgi:serine/threonine-protein kinase